MEEGNGGQVARATVIDVPLKAQRSLATVTAEIRTLQDAARRVVLGYSVEIGRRLVEAKSMVGHGEWGSYLREELGFSQSTANNHMRLFEAYGASQMTLDGAAVNSQALANLSYTQALALLALPSEEEREEFVREHDMSGMSTRELKEELRRRTGDPSSVTAEAVTPSPQGEGFETGDADASAPVRADVGIGPYSEQDDKNGDAGRIAELTAQLAKANSRAIDAEAARDRIIRETEESRGKAEAAERRAREADEQLKQAQKELEKAQKKLTAAEKNPKIPQATMDKLKAEAEEAAKKGMETDQAEVEQARAKVAQAEEEAAKARQEAEEMAHTVRRYTEEKERLEKELRLAAPEMTEFRVLFGQAQEAVYRCVEAIGELPPDKVYGCVRALKAALETALKDIDETKWEAAMPE